MPVNTVKSYLKLSHDVKNHTFYPLNRQKVKILQDPDNIMSYSAFEATSCVIPPNKHFQIEK